MKKLWPLLLLSVTFLTVSGFRSFPSLSEPDPRVVFSNFQADLAMTSDMQAMLHYLARRKRLEYEHQLAAVEKDPVATDRFLTEIQNNFVLMNRELVQDEVTDQSAILILKGKVNLHGQSYVPVTMGVLLVKEEGSWRIARQKLTFRRWTSQGGSAREESGSLTF